MPDISATHYDVRQLAGVLLASPDPIFIKGIDNRYHLVNRAFLETCGLTEAEGKSDVELFPPEMVSTVRAHDDQVMRQGVVIRSEELIQLKGDWRTFYVLKFPLFGGADEIVGMGGIATDITERRRAEADNARLTNRAEAVSQAAAHKSAFLATASHELRTPLGGIIGLTELLRRRALPDDSQHLVELIGDSAQGLLRLVNDLLDISKMEAGRMNFVVRPFCLREQLRALVATLEPAAAEQQVTLQICIDDPVPAWVEGDDLRVKQVLFNLMGNGTKFARGGRVRLHVGVQPAEQGSDPAAVILCFAVSDTGSGIAADELKEIFTPFYQVQQGIRSATGGHGTGLGLPICRSIVTAMGGKIAVESTPGAGSTFRFSLPLRRGAAPARTGPEPAADDGVAPADLGHILVVEDNLVNQTVICALLRQIGAAHTLATDGEAAVARYQADHFDTVLMDSMMPGIDGCEAARRMFSIAQRDDRPPPRIVALTASAMPEERQRCLQAGMAAFLVKPVGLAELRAALLKQAPRTRGSASGCPEAPSA